MLRRSFVATGAAALATPPAAPVKLGIDLFSIRSSGFSPIEYLDYCAKHKAKVVHFSEIRFLGDLQPATLKRVRAHAESLGISLEIGMRSICPTSKAFDASQGTAEQQLERMIAAAAAIGSPIVRAFLGTMADRPGQPGIEAHIENTAKVLRNTRARAMDAGVKIAIENHAGDMQGRELKVLIEHAGKDFVGACIDSGNPLWAIEDPRVTLEHLAPYVLTSHIRDTAVWRIPEGAAVAWTRMGEGNVGIGEYLKRYAEVCPGKAVTLEIIVTGPRKFAYLDPKFWDGYANVPAHEFSRFLAIAERGKERPAQPPVPKEQAPQRERDDLEASARWTAEFLGL